MVFVIIRHFLELPIAVAAEQLERGRIVAADFQPHGHAVALQGHCFSHFQQSIADPGSGIIRVNRDGIQPGNGVALRKQQQHIALNPVGLFRNQGHGMTASQQAPKTAAGDPVSDEALMLNRQQSRKIIQSSETRHGGSA